jgi:hypothetical protein
MHPLVPGRTRAVDFKLERLVNPEVLFNRDGFKVDDAGSFPMDGRRWSERATDRRGATQTTRVWSTLRVSASTCIFGTRNRPFPSLRRRLRRVRHRGGPLRRAVHLLGRRRRRVVVDIHRVDGPFLDFDDFGGEGLQEVGRVWEIFAVRPRLTARIDVGDGRTARVTTRGSPRNKKRREKSAQGGKAKKQERKERKKTRTKTRLSPRKDNSSKKLR